MRKVVCILLFFLSLIFQAQPPSRFFTRIGGEGDDVGYSGKSTLDGQYVVVGSSSSYFSNGLTDVYLVKVDSMGFPMWQKFYGGEGNDVGKSVIQLPDSGYVIAGFTSSYGAGGFDIFLLRTNKIGDLLWQKTFGGDDWDFASDLVLGSDGNIFVVGNTFSFGSGKRDGIVLKYDTLGNLLLQKFFGGVENEEFRSIIKTNDNFLATVGYTESRGEVNGDGYFLKLDLNADTLFTRTFGGAFKDYACDLIQKDASQNYEYVICGAKTFSSVTSKTHSYIYRMSANGSFINDGEYFKNGDDEEFTSVANSRDQAQLSAYVRTASFPNVKLQAEILVAYPNTFFYKINDIGEYEDDIAYSIESTKDGGYLIVGATRSYSAVGQDVFFVKHDSTCFNYVSVVGIKEDIIDQETLRVGTHYKKVFIAFELGEVASFITILDINGRIVKTVKVQNEDNLELDLSNLSSSIYLIKFDYEGKGSRYKKLIISD